MWVSFLLLLGFGTQTQGAVQHPKSGLLENFLLWNFDPNPPISKSLLFGKIQNVSKDFATTVFFGASFVIREIENNPMFIIK
jgi:hypothetical protein